MRQLIVEHRYNDLKVVSTENIPDDVGRRYVIQVPDGIEFRCILAERVEEAKERDDFEEDDYSFLSWEIEIMEDTNGKK